MLGWATLVGLAVLLFVGAHMAKDPSRDDSKFWPG